MSVSASYLFVGAHHLPHPRDVNAPQIDLQIENFRRFAGRAPVNTTEASAFSVPTVSSAAFTVRIPGQVAVNNATGQVFVAPAIANFFRPNAPNYFRAGDKRWPRYARRSKFAARWQFTHARSYLAVRIG
jgi:hypothetical protein